MEVVAGEGLLEAEALYVSAEGEAVMTSLGELAGDRVVPGTRVRRIRSFAGQRHYPGLFWSATTGGGHVAYESLVELDPLWLADFDPEVEWIASQPLWLSGMDGSTLRPARARPAAEAGRWVSSWATSSRLSSLPYRRWRPYSNGPNGSLPPRGRAVRGVVRGAADVAGQCAMARRRPPRLGGPSGSQDVLR